MGDIFVLLVLFQIKHFLCDYLLQNSYMLGKFKREGWEKPLLAHCGVHAVFTVLIVVVSTGNVLLACGLALLDLSIHFMVDRLKAHPDIGGKYKQDNPKFWWYLGVDQAAHHLTHYLIIAVIVGGNAL